MPPTGSPWRAWADYLWNRIRLRAIIARPDPVVLQKGAILKISVRPDSLGPRQASLYAQVSAAWFDETDFWSRPELGVIVTRQLRAGPQKLRAIQFDSNGTVWFSDIISVTTVTGQANELLVDLKPGVAVHGRLDVTVPRPVTNGRVVVHVWPRGLKAQDSPPDWHAFTSVREDGSFDISSLPAGDLELVALCDGFVSTNGPGSFQACTILRKRSLTRMTCRSPLEWSPPQRYRSR